MRRVRSLGTRVRVLQLRSRQQRVLTLEFTVINVTFETGCEKYKDLERGLFVGAGRFVIDGSGLGVEYKVSRVGWRPP
jgi:hypothetical protein